MTRLARGVGEFRRPNTETPTLGRVRPQIVQGGFRADMPCYLGRRLTSNFFLAMWLFLFASLSLFEFPKFALAKRAG